jgi:hypothetical protein
VNVVDILVPVSILNGSTGDLDVEMLGPLAGDDTTLVVSGSGADFNEKLSEDAVMSVLVSEIDCTGIVAKIPRSVLLEFPSAVLIAAVGVTDGDDVVTGCWRSLWAAGELLVPTVGGTELLSTKPGVEVLAIFASSLRELLLDIMGEEALMVGASWRLVGASFVKDPPVILVAVSRVDVDEIDAEDLVAPGDDDASNGTKVVTTIVVDFSVSNRVVGTNGTISMSVAVPEKLELFWKGALLCMLCSIQNHNNDDPKDMEWWKAGLAYYV